MSEAALSDDTQPGIAATVSTLALGTVGIATLLRQIWGIETAGLVADVALAIYIALEVRRLPALCKGVVIAALLLAIFTVMQVQGGLATMADAFGRATLVAALLAALGFVNEAARGSPLILRCGTALIEQPSQRRYLIMTLGSHLFALVLGVGVLHVLGSMITRSNKAAGGGDDQMRLRLRELTVGLARGFVTMPMWSPLSIAIAVVLTVVPTVKWVELLPVAMAVSGSFLLLGWLLDGYKLLPAFSGGPAPRETDCPLNWRPMARFAGLALLIVASTLGTAQTSGLDLSEAVIVTIPLIGIGWILVQHGGQGLPTAIRRTGRQLRHRVFAMFPNFRAEICLIGSGTIAGSALAAMLPPDLVRDGIQQAGLSPVPLASLFIVLIMLASQAGMGAVVGVSILGSAFPDPSVLHMSPLMLAVTFLCSWALSASSAPLGATMIILSALNGQPGRTMAFRWNGAFIVGGLLVSICWLVVLNGLS